MQQRKLDKFNSQANDEQSPDLPKFNTSEGYKLDENVDYLNIGKSDLSVIYAKQTCESNQSIAKNIPSSVDMRESYSSIFDFDDDTVSAVAAAATFLNDVDLKRELKDDQNFDGKRQRKFTADFGTVNDEELVDAGLSLESYHHLLNSDSVKSDDPKTKNLKFSKKANSIKFTPNISTFNIKQPKRSSVAKKGRKDLKGPVKHSRFFKVVGSEINNKNLKPSSVHHYNPYRYPQNRSKQNSFPDFIKTRKINNAEGSDSVTAASPDFLHESYLLSADHQSPSIPVLRPTVDEFENIYAYLDSIKEIGKKFGAVKVIPPTELVPKFSISLESFWIKTTRQLWNSSCDELNARTEFYTQLKELLRGKKLPLNKLPCIDKRSIDLYRLFRIVNLRGGFQSCCNDKLWAQIGRELGFYGKISSSLSSSIKSVYQKYLADWEDVLFENNIDYLYQVRNDETKSLFTKEKFLKNQPEVPIIIGSATCYTRNRKILADAGFCNYYDQATTQKKGITLSDTSTLPSYDFYNWSGINIEEDSNPTELKISSLYTLKQFYDKSRILKYQVLDKFKELEPPNFEDMKYLDKTFWKLLNNHELMFETEVALHQSTIVHESSYENQFITEKHGDLSSAILGSSNFNNISIVDDSVLQYTHAYSDTIYHSYLNFCMFYGSKAWSMEDHWLYNIDYHYLGDAKSHYFIPPADQEKYERLVEKYLCSRTDANKRTTETIVDFEKTISNADIYNACLENQVCYDLNLPRGKPRNTEFCQFIDDKTAPKRYNNDIMFSPELLRKNGITVYHAFQEVGEMIIKFPKTYSAYFSLGTSVTESINVAPHDWISYSLDAAKWLQKQQLIPQFSTFAMLLKTAYESSNRKILYSLLPVLEKRIHEELDKRTKIRACISEVKLDGDYNFQNMLSKLDFEGSCESKSTSDGCIFQENSQVNKVTDADLCDIFPTFVLISALKSKCESFTMSLDYFLNIRTRESYAIPLNNCKMISFVSDDYLKKCLMVAKAKLDSPRQWINRYHDLLSQYSRPPLLKVKPLLYEAETILNNKAHEESADMKLANREYKSLQRYVERTEEWILKAQPFLRHNSTINLPLENFKILLEDIKKLRISTDEVNQILNLADRIKRFDEDAIFELSKEKDKLDFRKLSSLHSEGLKINVKLKSFAIIDNVVKRAQWIESASRDPSSYEELELLYGQGCSFNLKNCNDLRILESLRKKVETSKAAISKFEALKRENQKVTYNALLELNKMSDLLPLSDVKRYTKDLMNEFKHISEIIVPLINTIRERSLIVSSANNLSDKITTYMQFSDHIGNLISNINLESTLKTLSKFEEFNVECQLFKDQFIDGPSLMITELDQVYNKLTDYYRNYIRLNSLADADILNHMLHNDADILNSINCESSSCEQAIEGEMIKYEQCQEEYHTGSIEGPNGAGHQRYQYYDVEINTKPLTSDKMNRPTFETMVMVAEKFMRTTSVTNSDVSTFLKVTQKYYELYHSICSQNRVQINVTEEGTTYDFPEDLKMLKSLLDKLYETFICFENLQNNLQEKYKELLGLTALTN
ncbi:hypothetical protein CANINC_001642 [Pichia inconspicua]|uniref:ARID domain-containing protein n=1 Tax=Pichia inconspicua TaxID=52247 RepID=A0A4T0X4N0_9ASCO|nr:hypothetical protein CANINC_001642 [[Candida] inconspicua]